MQRINQILTIPKFWENESLIHYYTVKPLGWDMILKKLFQKFSTYCMKNSQWISYDENFSGYATSTSLSFNH